MVDEDWDWAIKLTSREYRQGPLAKILKYDVKVETETYEVLCGYWVTYV